MNKYKYLLKNIGLLTISNFGTKILSFLLVPLYTKILTTSEYGTYDLMNTGVQLLVPILTINIYDTVMRFVMDDDNNIVKIFTIGVKITFGGCLILGGISLLISKISIIKFETQYLQYFWSLFVTNSIYLLFSALARGVGKIKELAFAGVISTFSICLFNILFLVYFKMGINGYMQANILGLIIPCVYLLITVNIRRYFTTDKTDKQLLHSMQKYSYPLIFNSISWWINSFFGRVIITWFCGVNVTGVYAAAYKIPSLLNTMQGIFSQAWQLSAVNEFDPEDSGGFFSKTYNIYNVVLLFLCSFLLIFSRVISKILFSNDFYIAWRFVPWLLISVIFGSLSGHLGGVFLAVKDSKIYGVSTMYGAISNIIISIILVKKFGAIGAAISTTFVYFFIWIIRIKNVKKIIKLKINLKKDIFAYFLLVVQAIILERYDALIAIYINLCVFLLIVLLYIKFLLIIFNTLKQILINRKV